MATEAQDRNAALKKQWDDLTAQIEEANQSGAARMAARLTRRKDNVANDFCAANRGLATAYARQFFTSAGKANRDDYVADALVGLWEAFLKWDPEQSTFGNFSRAYIEGRVKRGVATLEAEGISYGDFSARQKVREAETVLAEDLGRAPTVEEIATAAGQTASLVQRVRAARPASLDKTVGDGDTTLGDLVAEERPSAGDSAEVAAGFDPEAVFSLLSTAELDADQLFVVIRYHGFDGAPPQKYPGLARLTGVNRETLRRRMETAEAALPELVTLKEHSGA